MLEDALVAHAKATSIRLEVVPGSKQSGVCGYDEWRKRVRVSLSAPPREGEANKELLRLISGLFSVERDKVSITEGLRSRRKTVAIEGINVNEVLKVLRGCLP